LFFNNKIDTSEWFWMVTSSKNDKNKVFSIRNYKIKIQINITGVGTIGRIQKDIGVSFYQKVFKKFQIYLLSCVK